MGIPQARILEWVAISSSRGSAGPRDQTQVSHIAGGFFTVWASSEAYVTYMHFKNWFVRLWATKEIFIFNVCPEMLKIK